MINHMCMDVYVRLSPVTGCDPGIASDLIDDAFDAVAIHPRTFDTVATGSQETLEWAIHTGVEAGVAPEDVAAVITPLVAGVFTVTSTDAAERDTSG